MEKKEVNLRDYLEEKNLTPDEFVELTGVSRPTVYRIMANPNWSTSVKNCRKIYNATKKKYGVGLDIWQYLNK